MHRNDEIYSKYSPLVTTLVLQCSTDRIAVNDPHHNTSSGKSGHERLQLRSTRKSRSPLLRNVIKLVATKGASPDIACSWKVARKIGMPTLGFPYHWGMETCQWESKKTFPNKSSCHYSAYSNSALPYEYYHSL